MGKKKVELPQTGVINPYALVASRKGMKVDWKNLSPAESRKLVETELKMPFDKLFDPKHRSPLFSYPRRPAGSGSGTVQTGDIVPRCSKAVGSWSADAGGAFSSPPPDINDANQGCSLDCWFVAALASVAWTWPDFIKRALVSAVTCYLYLNKGSTTITDPPYIPAAGTDYTPVRERDTTSYSLPWGASGVGDWVFCRPSSAHPHYLWSALFEKCYARFWKLGDYVNDKPGIASFRTGSPMPSLLHLTGKRFYSKLDQQNNPAHIQSVFDMTEFSSADTIFDKIYSQCYIVVSGGGSPVAVPAMPVYPMVAWTYPSESDANTANGVTDPNATPEKAVKYTNDSIVAQHSYSILGVHYVDSKKYIVLRNPWGMAISGAYGGDPVFVDPKPGTQFSPYYDQMNAALYKGNWTVTPKPANNNTCLGVNPAAVTTNLATIDGIFALAADKFRWHFKGFGWVWN